MICAGDQRLKNSARATSTDFKELFLADDFIGKNSIGGKNAKPDGLSRVKER
jgi:hypothetical protein